jgi:2'-5' RNA ligase
MSLRLFAALEIPDVQAERLRAIMRGVGGAKWRPRENLHLTLRFFDEVAEPVARDLDAELDQIAQAIAPFDIHLKGAGFFGKEEPHALWVGAADNAALKTLAAECERAARRAKMAPEARKFAPHVTLAYLSGANLARVVAFQQRYALFETATWRVESFQLYSSHVRKNAPSLYREEAAYPLMG